MRVGWRFRDLITAEEYFLPVNPTSDSGSHAFSKVTAYEVPISTHRTLNGQTRVDDVVIYNKPKEVERFSYSGTVYTEDQLVQFERWAAKPYEWELKDDLGREFVIYVEEFTTERQRSVKYPWKHSYSFSGLVLREAGI